MTEATFKKYCLVIDQYFVNGFNGVKAYQEYYPTASYNTCDKGFRDIHDNPRIQRYIKTKYKAAQTAQLTSHKRLLEEIQNWAYSDITEALFLDPEQLKELPKEIRRLITKFKHTKRNVVDGKGKVLETINTIELHFVSKEKAMEMIHKHTGFYELDNSQKNQPKKVDINIIKKKEDNGQESDSTD